MAAISGRPALAADEKDDDDKGGSVDAKRRFTEGNERYARGDYAGAVESFKAAIAADPKLPGPYRNLGLAHRATGNCEAALPMYQKYLELKPESRHTERVRREIDICRAKLGLAPAENRTAPQAPTKAEAQAWLHVAANIMEGEATDEASVRVDGLVRGSTPLTIPVTAGVHKVHLERPGWESVGTTVDVQPGERKEVELTMNRLPEAPRPVTAVPVGDPEAGPGRPLLRKYAWAMLGVAAGVGLLGAGLGIAESAEHAETVTADPQTTRRSEVNEEADTGKKLAIGAWVTLGVAGAALATSVLLFAFDGKRGETREKQKYVIAPSPAPGGGSLVALVRF